MDLKEEISRVAYELYIKSGCIPGRDMDNWLEAERIVMEKYKTVNDTPTEKVEETTEEKAKPKKVKVKTETSSTKKKTAVKKSSTKSSKKKDS